MSRAVVLIQVVISSLLSTITPPSLICLHLSDSSLTFLSSLPLCLALFYPLSDQLPPPVICPFFHLFIPPTLSHFIYQLSDTHAISFIPNPPSCPHLEEICSNFVSLKRPLFISFGHLASRWLSPQLLTPSPRLHPFFCCSQLPFSLRPLFRSRFTASLCAPLPRDLFSILVYSFHVLWLFHNLLFLFSPAHYSPISASLPPSLCATALSLQVLVHLRAHYHLLNASLPLPCIFQYHIRILSFFHSSVFL